MRRGRFRNIDDVVRWRLCVGCGVCAFACEKKNIVLRDVPERGIRPRVRRTECEECGKCLEVCPGLGASHGFPSGTEVPLIALRKGWGPILEVWEGHAADPEIRYRGSSGGAATAIAQYCLEAGLAGGVLHTGTDESEPWRNRTVLSTNRQELLSRAGSRYSPASPGEGLDRIAASSSPLVFIGKPCDVQGLRKAEALAPLLRKKTAAAVGIFCAGTPATSGLLNLLKKIRFGPEEVGEIRFRGSGWPGTFSVRRRDREEFSSHVSYQESWGFLQAYRPFRCYLCPDGTGELADISCGDAWYKASDGSDAGTSLVLVRSARGREIVAGALQAGTVRLQRVGAEALEKSQENLLEKRMHIWGRLLAMRACGIPVPRYGGFHLFENWRGLPVKGKARSVLGTARRILQRKYYRPENLFLDNFTA